VRFSADIDPLRQVAAITEEDSQLRAVTPGASSP
jgi:hypothetical protein